MKKIITSVLMLVCFMFCFSACSEPLSEEYWLDTSAELTQYFATPEYNKVANITFSSNINTIIAGNYSDEFAELTNVYAKLFTASAFTAEKFATVLTVTPVNSEGELKNKILDVNTKLKNLKEAVNIFLNEKSVYEDSIDFTDETTVKSAFERHRLVKFKMEYLKVIDSAYQLSNSLYDAYTVGYYTFSDFENIDPNNFSQDQAEINRRLAINGANLQLVDSAINVLNIYNAKEIYYNYNDYWHISQDFFANVVQYAYNNTLTTDPSLLSKFVVWKGVYESFLQDSKTFENIVANLKIDLLKSSNNDVQLYATKTGNPLDATNANFFLNYYKNVHILYDYTIALV